MPAKRLVPLPAGADVVHSAAAVLNAFVALQMLRRVARVRAADPVLVRGAARRRGDGPAPPGPAGPGSWPTAPPCRPSTISSPTWVYDASRRAFPDLHITINELIGEGDTVSVPLTARGTHEGAFHCLPATDRSAAWEGIGMIRVAEGKIVARWFHADVPGLMRQLRAGPSGLPARL